MKRAILVGALTLMLVLGACDRTPAARGGSEGAAETTRAAAPTTAQAPSAGDVVDSVFPMDVMLERFRQGMRRPERLEGGADSRDGLVRAVVHSLEVADTAAFERLAVSLPEYAWLYFPSASIAKPPYELPPGLAWFRVQEGNRKGVFRALREFGGHRVDLRSYRCPDDPVVEGENRTWNGCTVTLLRDGEELSLRLFGSILERDGRFAILSYENDF